MKVVSVGARALALAGLGVALCGVPNSQAALTAPVDATVYRGDVPVQENTGGRVRSALTPADVPGVASLDTQGELDTSAGGTLFGARTGCLVKGNGLLNSNVTNPLRTLTDADTATQGSVVITRDADNAVVYSQGHLSNQDFLAAPSPSSAQPFGGTWLTQGATAGTYTARSYKRDIVRGDANAAVGANDTAAQKASKRNALATCRINTSTTATPNPDVLVSTVKFEYRPWEQRFRDTLQTSGGIDFNLNSSREFQLTLRGNRQSVVRNAPEAYTVVKLPSDAGLLLPADPSVCADDIAACLPPTPPACAENPAACTDRLVVLSYGSSTEEVIGFFDLKTRAFVAYVKVGNSVAVLKSAGDLDAQVLALKQQLIAAAAPLGIDAARISAMKLSSVSDGGTQTALSLDEGLEQLAGTGMVNGATVQGAPSAQAGVIVHTILGGYQGTAAGPYKVTGTLTTPATPGLPALPALPAPLTTYGPLIEGLIGTSGIGARQVSASRYTGGRHVYALAAGVEPTNPKLVYIPTDVATISDSSIDFVGAPLSVTQGGVCNAQGACVGVAFFVGAGGAVYDSPVAIPPLLP
ncbi:hypothetical protein DSM112329_04694 [Paraconexibacter sp. AEG42_29]|uniref:Uncharacterized protein n=1 Tax=Paraconexibacter sp. AEG42_29 TaxID=2997339 RepID=A0AAU7B1P8_9ACTN